MMPCEEVDVWAVLSNGSDQIDCTNVCGNCCGEDKVTTDSTTGQYPQKALPIIHHLLCLLDASYNIPLHCIFLGTVAVPRSTSMWWLRAAIRQGTRSCTQPLQSLLHQHALANTLAELAAPSTHRAWSHVSRACRSPPQAAPHPHPPCTGSAPLG